MPPGLGRCPAQETYRAVRRGGKGFEKPGPEGGKGFEKPQPRGGKGFEKIVRKGSLRFENRQLASPRELQPRHGVPLHAPAELAVDDLADGLEQPRASLRWQRRVI